ncbi:MAG TPA: 6-carboxytetrahydropterin synthase [Bdellovibrionales bacterium]|nr:6-carboxytetrahydropterin synthase [Bdellovibrionales bacterium]
MYTIHLAKEPFKFSCSHFTILTPTYAERLHGHNYQVRVSISCPGTDPRLGLVFDFNKVKPMIRSFCQELDERILIPERSPFLTIDKSEDEVELKFRERRYVFPLGDTRFIPVVNITTEELARLACEKLHQEMRDLPVWTGLKVNVEETRGQSISYKMKR